ncbi:MAG TPA: hypothetical protein VGQ83_28520 [Polyangia bacterium]|jgi:hypothetical protein
MAEEKRTAFAMQALGFAELFALQVGSHRVEGPVSFRVELAAPEGQSTLGGRQALQHIRLVPDGGGPVTVPGWANSVEKTAELRTYEHVAALHAQRFHGAPLPCDRAQYDALLARMEQFFREAGLAVTFAGPPAGLTAPMAAAPAPAKSSSTGVLVAILAVVVVLVGVGVFFLLRARG